MKKVSVIMSTYKTDKKMLMDSINSILNQTYTNLEFIIVCDGDKEEYEFLENAIKDDRVILLKNSKNMGLPYSLNLAIEKANGEYIARMDSDDISLPNRIQTQVEFLEKNQDIVLCSTYVVAFGNIQKNLKLFLKNPEQIRIQLLYRATMIHPSVMAKSEIFKKFKYNEKFKYAQDFELWSRVSDYYKISVVQKCCLKYRIHNKAISSEKKAMQDDFSKKIIRNNSLKITGKFEERIFNCLCVLGGKEKLTKKNYSIISKDIDYIISQNNIYNKYDTKQLKKVLFNRYFELIIKNKIFTLNLSVLKKCIKLYNFQDLLFKFKNMNKGE